MIISFLYDIKGMFFLGCEFMFLLACRDFDVTHGS